MTEPTMRILSLGAGIQSTTIALLAVEGRLPRPDAAIFSDTGFEPEAVYRHLDRLEAEVLRPAGIPLYRVSGGNLSVDVLDPNQMRNIPAYTATKPYEATVVDEWKLCADLDCGWRRLREAAATEVTQDEATLFDVSPADLSDMEDLFNAILVLPEDVDLATLADLATAPDAFEADVESALHAARALRRAGMDRFPAPHQACGSTGRVSAREHTEMRRDFGMMRRRCTQLYKLNPILTQVRRLLGAPEREPLHCRFCDGTGERVAPWRAKLGDHTIGPCSVCDGEGTTSRVGSPPKDAWAEQWVGFSTDEMERVSPRGDTRYSRSRYPLLELDMSRTQCETYLQHHGWTAVTKSACIGCPLRGNAEWRRMRETDPESWAAAVKFDHDYRTGPGMRKDRYLHISRLPLDEAPIERIRPIEWAPGTVGDHIFEADLEEGDPDGCSPWGCHSGEPVTP